MLVSLSLTACQTTGLGEIRNLISSGAVDKETVALYCNTYKPVLWSKHDTKDTQKQNVANNKIWKSFCK